MDLSYLLIESTRGGCLVTSLLVHLKHGVEVGGSIYTWHKKDMRVHDHPLMALSEISQNWYL
jgi:hypothetical protein